ncbi:unnamed protein product [Caenorhabditis sp. 36 PRJEB53466]|nr:unnamed protein product [Caenorhabditis sp. 36 PRJEB53466]
MIFPIILRGKRISGAPVSEFCGALAVQKLFKMPEEYRQEARRFNQQRASSRDGIHFKPVKPIPIPVINLTLQIPYRWLRDPGSKFPLVYVCYEGSGFLKILQFGMFPTDWEMSSKFFKTIISNQYNERCRIREVLVVLDDEWNNRNLLPKTSEAHLLVNSKSLFPRVAFTNKCNQHLGLEQPCCLWEFHFHSDGQLREFNRCFGSIPSEAIKSKQIPELLADLLYRGGMSRRFITPPIKVCREIEFEPMTVRDNNGQLITMNRLNATKCAAFF